MASSFYHKCCCDDPPAGTLPLVLWEMITEDQQLLLVFGNRHLSHNGTGTGRYQMTLPCGEVCSCMLLFDNGPSTVEQGSSASALHQSAGQTDRQTDRQCRSRLAICSTTGTTVCLHGCQLLHLTFFCSPLEQQWNNVSHPQHAATIAHCSYLLPSTLLLLLLCCCMCRRSCQCPWDGVAGNWCEEITEQFCVNQCSGHGTCECASAAHTHVAVHAMYAKLL